VYTHIPAVCGGLIPHIQQKLTPRIQQKLTSAAGEGLILFQYSPRFVPKAIYRKGIHFSTYKLEGFLVQLPQFHALWP